MINQTFEQPTTQHSQPQDCYGCGLLRAASIRPRYRQSIEEGQELKMLLGQMRSYQYLSTMAYSLSRVCEAAKGDLGKTREPQTCCHTPRRPLTHYPRSWKPSGSSCHPSTSGKPTLVRRLAT
jgi:hypothetical protein